MISPKYSWLVEAEPASPDFLKAAKKEGLDDLAATIAYSRGIQTAEIKL